MSDTPSENEIDPLVLLSQSIDQVAAERELLTQSIHHQMVPGVHFGTITIKGKESKPTLFKAGSELVIQWYGVTPVFMPDTETVRMLGGDGNVAFICELIRRTENSPPVMVAMGRGACSMRERDNMTVNSCIKMAQKRAQVDAVLRMAGMSDAFTQDLEDDPASDPVSAPSYPDTRREWGDLFQILSSALGFTDMKDPTLWKRVSTVLKRDVEPSKAPLQPEEVPQVVKALARTVKAELGRKQQA